MSKDARLAVLLSGNGSNFQAILDAIDRGRLSAEVAVAVSNRKQAFGLQRAEAAGVPTIYHPLKPYRETGRGREEYDRDLVTHLKPFAPDWIVLAGWLHIFTREFLMHFPDQVLNLHPALPGQFPGLNAIEQAYEAFQRGEIKHTGAMIHAVPDERVDEGPVLAAEEIPIRPDDTLESLTRRVHRREHDLLIDTLVNLVSDGQEACAQ